MLRKTLLLTLFCAAVLAVPALAAEVVYFTNGTSMPIVSHIVEADMINVSLGGGSFMAFPIDQIERIEDADGKVSLLDGSGNQMVPSPSDSYRVQGTVPSRHRRGKWDSDASAVRTRRRGTDVDADEHGIATLRPFAGSTNEAKSKMRVAGRQSLYQQPVAESREEGLIGTQRVGNRYVIPGTSPASGGRKVQPVGLTARDGSGSGSTGDSGSSGGSGENK